MVVRPPFPVTTALCPPTLKSLSMKVILLCQRAYLNFHPTCLPAKEKNLEFQNSLHLPKTISDELFSFFNLSGSFVALDGLQMFWRKEGNIVTPTHFYVFDWEGRYTEGLDFENYPFTPYFQPEKFRFYMDISHNFSSNPDYFGTAVKYSMNPDCYHSSSNLTFKNSHNPFSPTQNFPEDGKWINSSWKLTDFMPDKVSDINEFITKSLSLKLDHLDRYYHDGEFLIFEQQKNHEISQNVEIMCITKYKLQRLPDMPLWPLNHPIYAMWPSHVLHNYLYYCITNYCPIQIL